MPTRLLGAARVTSDAQARLRSTRRPKQFCFMIRVPLAVRARDYKALACANAAGWPSRGFGSLQSARDDLHGRPSRVPVGRRFVHARDAEESLFAERRAEQL